MDGSGDAQAQNDISDSFFSGGQVGLEGTVSNLFNVGFKSIDERKMFLYGQR